ncbi:hypothetical protein RB195_008491 [Necator americanus]
MRIRLKRPRIYFYFLTAVVTIALYVHFFSVTPPLEKEVALELADFYKLSIKKYGQFRVLDELCIEEGCFFVRDALLMSLVGLPIERQLLLTNPMRIKAAAILEIPKETVLSRTDSRNWNMVTKYIPRGSLEHAMIEAALLNGGLLLNTRTKTDVLIVGIGSGVIANYIQYKYRWSKITMIEKHETMARFLLKWFQLHPNKNFKITAGDTLDMIRKFAQEGAKYHVVFFNICMMSFHRLPCPTVKDLPDDIIQSIAKMVDHTGTFVINLMTDGVDAESAYKRQKHRLERYFNECLLLKPVRVYNNVLSCSQTFHNLTILTEVRKFLEA